MDISSRVGAVTQTGLIVENMGQIRSMQMPPGWIAGSPEINPTIGNRYLYPYYNPRTPETRICLFYRGLPMNPEATKTFRDYIHGGPRVLFVDSDEAPPESAVNAINELAETLDNAWNNQVVNKESGPRGPNFHLNRAEITKIARRSVLSVTGWFRQPEEDRRTTDYWGIFADGNPGVQNCPVQEIFLEAPNEQEFRENLNWFEETLKTIHWRHDPFDRS